MRTDYAPAERAPPAEILDTARVLSEKPTMGEICNAVSSAVAILNGFRQIVYANREFLGFLGIEALEPILGLRPGEAVNCIHAGKSEGGCGTTSQCRWCGAVQAVLDCMNTGRRSERETRLTVNTDKGPASLELTVTATPYHDGHALFTLITLKDNRDTRRKEIMERLFFHDILNSAAGVHGALELLNEYSDKNEGADLIGLSLMSSRNLIEEVQTYRMVIKAERGELEVNPVWINGLELLKQAASNIRYHEVVRNKRLEIDADSLPLELLTDETILTRILVNMIKNALEATPEQGTAQAGLHRTGTRARFRVWNRTVMQPEVKSQIFQRSFSTKGKDRGLGTWSILLFGEQYLKGLVAFTSEEGKGTEFTLDLDMPGEES
jgi:signal transduction histidine kinase